MIVRSARFCMILTQNKFALEREDVTKPCVMLYNYIGNLMSLS